VDVSGRVARGSVARGQPGRGVSAVDAGQDLGCGLGTGIGPGREFGADVGQDPDGRDQRTVPAPVPLDVQQDADRGEQVDDSHRQDGVQGVVRDAEVAHGVDVSSPSGLGSVPGAGRAGCSEGLPSSGIKGPP
jgi:hypothetical protein